jgi:hypothetical protein
MPTYYVNYATGLNTTDGSSGAPWKTLTYAVATAGSGDTIIMSSGQVYIEPGRVLIGEGLTITTDDPYTGFFVDVSATDSDGLLLVGANTTITGLSGVITTVNPSKWRVWIDSTATNTTFNFSRFNELNEIEGRGVRVYAQTIFNKCIFKNAPLTTGLKLEASTTFNYCVLKNYMASSFNNATIKYNCCAVVDSFSVAIDATDGSTGVTTLDGCVVSANGWGDANPSILNRTGSILNVVLKNCYFSAKRIDDGVLVLNGYTDGGGNIDVTMSNDTALPLFRSPSAPGCISLCVDDGSSLAYFLDFALACNAYGLTATLAANPSQPGYEFTNANYDSLASLIIQGHDVCSHGLVHANYHDPLYISGADGNYLTSGTPTALLLNDVSESKRILEDGINMALARAGHPQNYTCDVFVAPYNHTGPAVVSACLAAGFTGVRGSAISTYKKSIYTDLDVTNLWSIPPQSAFVAGKTERGIGGYLSATKAAGEWTVLFGHNPVTTPGEFTVEQWDPIFDILSRSGIPVVTMRNMVKHIKGDLATILAAPTSSPDGYNYLRSVVTDSSDYHLQSTSPCIGTGVAITGIHTLSTPATDADGNIVHFLPPNIGPYDGRTIKSVSADYSPTGYDVRGTSTSPATIKVTADNVTVNLSGLTQDEEIVVKSTKKVGGFVGKSSKQYLKGSGGGSSNSVFGNVFG